eukprot:GAHX01000015.1.p1 GENE.GAHX01000015.1~~GAHX01000015.1.p1  ORF type:complete len:121 (-),score=32.79 GAHX01000015.1:37-399(-)
MPNIINKTFKKEKKLSTESLDFIKTFMSENKSLLKAVYVPLVEESIQCKKNTNTPIVVRNYCQRKILSKIVEVIEEDNEDLKGIGEKIEISYKKDRTKFNMVSKFRKKLNSLSDGKSKDK